jgi:hypothetical protein
LKNPLCLLSPAGKLLRGGSQVPRAATSCLPRVDVELPLVTPPSLLSSPSLSLACSVPCSLFLCLPCAAGERRPSRRQPAPAAPTPRRRLQPLRLAALLLPVKGIEPGRLQSPPASPFLCSNWRTSSPDSPCSGDLRPCRPRRRS